MKCLPYATVLFIFVKRVRPAYELLSVHRWWFCCCLFILYCCSHCLCGFVLSPCFALQYFLSFLVLQLSRWGRERELNVYVDLLVLRVLPVLHRPDVVVIGKNTTLYIEKHAICHRGYRLQSFLSIQYVNGDLC